MRLPESSGGTSRSQDRLAEIDARIVQLIRQRIEEEHLLADARRAAGLPRTDLSRENETVRYYDQELKTCGANLALLLLVMR
ncbi:hypothetical protein [Streptomyces sp. MnatMP-M17]|uniref:hypothetical protein n=1 Tax=unclassified Streptomyces TaxID=2593676 RepID=UPI00081E2F15|nr:hypothetical protein [Streptomyces sp. MnatMP-M17]MYZ39190.1 hypothetical protein [Streptomyces sp. SID4917]SCG02605.1 chorismate mutase [Streptomyces sp. MnatMP-M17]